MAYLLLFPVYPKSEWNFVNGIDAAMMNAGKFCAKLVFATS